MIRETNTIAYFGEAVVEQAVTDYFARYGLTEQVREDLMVMAVHKEDDFFQMIDDYIMKKN